MSNSYTNMKKDDLIKRILELEQRAKENEHLPKAIEAKDGELVECHREHGRLKEELASLKQKAKESEHLPAAVLAKDNEISNLKSALNELKTSNAEEMQRYKNQTKVQLDELGKQLAEAHATIKTFPDINKINADIKKVLQENKRLTNFIATYREMFLSFAKTIQGSLNNTANLEDMMFKGLVQEKQKTEE